MASHTLTTMQSTSPFPFPRDYFFPPFFTRQTNLTTHHAQLVKWASLVLSYCRHYRIFKLPLPGSANTPIADAAAAAAATGDPSELFHNKTLNRRLSLADAREVIDVLRKDGRAEYVGGGDSGDVVWVYWRKPEEWAALLEAWIDETAQKGSVLTMYELTQGEGTRGTQFHGLDAELLQKALNILAKKGKAHVFGDSQGVKFL